MIVLRSDDEIATIRDAGRILAATMERLKASMRHGIRTDELDEMARHEILKRNGYPAFKGYKGFPGNICTSINEVVVHGIPSGRRLRDGDILSVDIGVRFKGYYADAAFTCGIGKIITAAERLITVTEEALYKGIEAARPDGRLGDISSAIQKHVESNGFTVVRVFVGHGIGTAIHEEPEVPNFGKVGTGPRLDAGMVLAIEPMVNAGSAEVEIHEDGWTATTKDKRLSAHFEHTIVITESGAEILTK